MNTGVVNNEPEKFVTEEQMIRDLGGSYRYMQHRTIANFATDVLCEKFIDFLNRRGIVAFEEVGDTGRQVAFWRKKIGS